jgi:hypothetical protein
MAEYKGIKGFKVQYLSADPSDPNIGQTWYNDTSKDLKYTGATAAGAWATGNNMGTARQYLAGCGTQTAGLAFGGSPPITGATEEYDGTNWSPQTGLNTARQCLAGAGTQTAGLAFGGGASPPTNTTDATEEYDGSAWTAGGNLLLKRRYLGGCGTQTAGLAFGGYTPAADIPSPSPAFYANTEEYNGTSWFTSPASLNTARRGLGSAGTQTAALGFGGQPGAGETTITEEYDGTSWTAGGALNTARFYLAGAGTQTAALGSGGGPPTTAATELYDGTSWVSNPTGLNTARTKLAGAGTQASALAFGGDTPPVTAATEEWLGAGSAETKTITVS